MILASTFLCSSTTEKSSPFPARILSSVISAAVNEVSPGPGAIVSNGAAAMSSVVPDFERRFALALEVGGDGW